MRTPAIAFVPSRAAVEPMRSAAEIAKASKPVATPISNARNPNGFGPSPYLHKYGTLEAVSDPGGPTASSMAAGSGERHLRTLYMGAESSGQSGNAAATSGSGAASYESGSGGTSRSVSFAEMIADDTAAGQIGRRRTDWRTITILRPSKPHVISFGRVGAARLATLAG